MRRTIRITESELRHLIGKTVTKYLNEVRGYVPNDGNPMVGGYYDSWERYGECEILNPFIDQLENIFGQSEELDRFYDYCLEDEDSFTIECKFEVGYDESVGYGSRSMPEYELKDVMNAEDAINCVSNYQTEDENFKNTALKVLEELIDNIDDLDFRFDEE